MLILAKEFCQSWRGPPLNSKTVIATQFHSRARKQMKKFRAIDNYNAFWNHVINKLENVKYICFMGIYILL